MQMVAEYWAQQFNKKSPPEHKVAFVVAQVLELPRRSDGPQRWASLEPLLSGEYAKFNNNAGAVLGGRTAQAFSHFTVVESGEQLCICDLQGVGGSLFTDPQIHSRAGSFGDGTPPKDAYGNELAPWKPLTRQAITPSEAELEVNSRARSVRLRVGERTEHEPPPVLK
jgi:hypothetical protein